MGKESISELPKSKIKWKTLKENLSKLKKKSSDLTTEDYNAHNYSCKTQRKLDSQELWHTHVPRIPESQDHKRHLDSEKFWHNQNHKKDSFQSKTPRVGSTGDNQMARGKHKNISNRNQGYKASWEPSSPPTASPEYPITSKKQDSDLTISHDDDRGL